MNRELALGFAQGIALANIILGTVFMAIFLFLGRWWWAILYFLIAVSGIYVLKNLR